MCNPVTTHRPDVLLAKGEHAGFQWEVTKNGLGYRCGYVRLPKGHPWHGKDYDDEPLYDIEVHGGLTFAAADTDCGKGGEDKAWWLGFDCAHLGDAADPTLMDERQRAVHVRIYSSLGPGYRSHDTIKPTVYVAAECRSLCEQAAAAALTSGGTAGGESHARGVPRGIALPKE
jgi:hypothetical protein